MSGSNKVSLTIVVVEFRHLYLYGCSLPGLEDYSSRPGFLSRSLSRGGFLSLSSKHCFFFARDKNGKKKGKNMCEIARLDMIP